MTSPIQYVRAPAADFVLPFDLANVHVRGRLVRLKDVSARALLAHALPEPAARIAAETLTLAALLGSALKLGGRLTVQTKSDGALDLAASDYYGAEEGRIAGLRGYARANDDAVKALGAAPSFAALAGKGSLAITIEPRVAGPGGGQADRGRQLLALFEISLRRSRDAVWPPPPYMNRASPCAGAPAGSCCNPHPTPSAAWTPK